MNKLAAQQIQQEYYKLGAELALQQGGLLKTASKTRNALAALAALGAGTGAIVGGATLGGELGSRLFSNESFLEQLPKILSNKELSSEASKKVLDALGGARVFAPAGGMLGFAYGSIPAADKVYTALRTPRKGLFI